MGCEFLPNKKDATLKQHLLNITEITWDTNWELSLMSFTKAFWRAFIP